MRARATVYLDACHRELMSWATIKVFFLIYRYFVCAYILLRAARASNQLTHARTHFNIYGGDLFFEDEEEGETLK